METFKAKTMEMDKVSLTSIGQRLKSATPPFWAKVRRLMIGCGALGGALYAIPAEHTAWIPACLQNLDSILITVGVVGTALSSLTAKDQPAS